MQIVDTEIFEGRDDIIKYKVPVYLLSNYLSQLPKK